MSKFIPGMKLNQMYYEQIVKRILGDFFPGLPYSAGLIDYGSDVLGFDTPVSRDHQWGPRLSNFLSKKKYAKYSERISETLSEQLPYEFHGYPTNFSEKLSDGVRRLEKLKSGKVNHLIRIQTMEDFLQQHLGIDIIHGVSLKDWLFFPQQRLATIRRGKIFHDDLGIAELKKKLYYYPEDIRLYLMASEWSKIASEEAFVGRCGDCGDGIGSGIIASRIIQSIMNLCFLMEKEYAPYSKWFGTAFSKLKSSRAFMPIFERILRARSWKGREKNLSLAYELLAKNHNDLNITEPMHTKVIQYYGREYLVIFAEKFSKKILGKITDAEIKNLKLTGSIDQITNVTNILEYIDVIKKLTKLYE
jgi:hypothetical protein